MNVLNVDSKAERKALIEDCKAVERAAVALFDANHGLAARGRGDAMFSAVRGGPEYLATWRQWLRDNLGVDW
jgi:hypothetical protein